LGEDPLAAFDRLGFVRQIVLDGIIQQQQRRAAAPDRQFRFGQVQDADIGQSLELRDGRIQRGIGKLDHDNERHE